MIEHDPFLPTTLYLLLAAITMTAFIIKVRFDGTQKPTTNTIKAAKVNPDLCVLIKREYRSNASEKYWIDFTNKHGCVVKSNSIIDYSYFFHEIYGEIQFYMPKDKLDLL